MRAVILLVLIFPSVLQAGESPRCTELHDRMLEAVEAANNCFDNTDCIAPFIGCPLGCGTPVNKHADLELLHLMHRDYDRECVACMYKCSGEVRALHCVDGRCVMDFSE